MARASGSITIRGGEATFSYARAGLGPPPPAPHKLSAAEKQVLAANLEAQIAMSGGPSKADLRYALAELRR